MLTATSHKTYTLAEVAKITGGQLLQAGQAPPFQHLALDSRKLTHAASSVFFAIPGKRHDGHAYLPEAYQKGVRNFVVCREVNLADFPEAAMLHVPDSTEALQRLAAHHRQQFALPVIGITGSNGKTIVKEWLSQLLAPEHCLVKNPKSYNSQTGVPLSVWPMNEGHALGIFEAGISRPGEMERLKPIIAPTIGILTNIGEAHAEGFLNKKHKTKEKLKLFVDAGILIYCKDYHEINEALADIYHHFQQDEATKNKLSVFTWSRQTDAGLRITRVAQQGRFTIIEGKKDGQPLSIRIPFSDEASIENAIHCWATLLYLDYAPEVISQRMERLPRVAMRLELKDAINNCSLINDSYNSDLGSLAIALDFLNQQKQHAGKTVILSDILQSGKQAGVLYRQVLELLTAKGVSKLHGIGPELSQQAGLFAQARELQSCFYPTTDAFLQDIRLSDFHEETILLKGARPFQFERISRLLEKKAHQTILEINLSALAHNLNVYASRLKDDTRLMAMVKAFSYGSGSYEIANVLQFHRVDYLAVAYADEGMTLREKGITLPIMVMNPEPAGFEIMIKHRLEPEIYDVGTLQQFEAVMDYLRLTGGGEPYPVHLKTDTGMHRLGFDEAALPELLRQLQQKPWFRVASIFSHLAASDAAVHDGFTRQQLARFERMSAWLMEGLGYRPLRHVLNSAGILRFPEAQYDMARLGLGLYGVDPTGLVQGQLQPVSTLKSTIAQVKRIPAGDTIGYNRSWQAEREMTIGIVGIGYADGLNRLLGNGTGAMLVQGRLAPIVGDVCMDLCMIDLTGHPEAQAGQEVTVFGAQPTVTDLARQTATIPYEVMTSVSARVKRVYFQE